VISESAFCDIGRSLRLSAERFGDKPALTELGRFSLTYRELESGCNRLAHRLSSMGAGRGDHIGILSENSVEHIVALYAIAKIGAVSIALDPKWTNGELERALARFDCRLVIYDETLAAKLSNGSGVGACCDTLPYERLRDRCELLESSRGYSAASFDVEISDDEICAIVLTSGTTGVSKGVIRSHRNVERGCINGVLVKGQDERSRELAVVPLYYGSGRGSVLSQIFIGGTVVVMPKFDPEEVAWTIGAEKITAVALAPTMCSRILRSGDLSRFDFSSLTSMRKAGSPFTRPVLEEVLRKITPHVYQSYSSTETGTVCVLRPHEQLSKFGSSGRPIWGVEARLAEGDRGEIWVRGPNVFQGYYKDSVETSSVLQGGWCRTGDLGEVDQEGYLHVVGRLKDMIKTGGISVSPKEVEAVIISLAEVADVAVVGVPDEEWGEMIKALVVPASKACNADLILSHCRAELAPYKVPKQIVFSSAIQRNALGKFVDEVKSPVR
jgi:acyl-CoA synthetase (AMP-forming)/AMP-acid ligase II